MFSFLKFNLLILFIFMLWSLKIQVCVNLCSKFFLSSPLIFIFRYFLVALRCADTHFFGGRKDCQRIISPKFSLSLSFSLFLCDLFSFVFPSSSSLVRRFADAYISRPNEKRGGSFRLVNKLVDSATTNIWRRDWSSSIYTIEEVESVVTSCELIRNRKE